MVTNFPKVILISQMPLPYPKIGSWTTLYKNYFESKHQVDYIICEPPEKRFDTVEYAVVENTLQAKIIRKWKKNRYVGYLNALEELLQPDQKYIIQIVDNYGIVKPLLKFLSESGYRQHCYLQFCYHGFPPFYENFAGRWFFEGIDEMVVLTHDSYKAHKDYYTVLPTRFSVLHNGVDTKKFHPIATDARQLLKEEYGVINKKVFVWCAQDRPKKGLHIVLDAWKNVIEKRNDCVLWIIGTEPKEAMEGVRYFGKIPNDELAKYLQAADCYLFSTLCHEGFGLSLIEALHCGNYCIASALGGVPEVLQYGKFGKLIESPHFVSEWEKAMLDFAENPEQSYAFDTALYTTENWNAGMNTIIASAQKKMAQ
ncbi:glycosyltransferase family 4 protein [Flavobacterium sp. CAU 1735]|uniref:glycosyltransferase family 4 protein n=1 Tax=Flavobacterium sp. CAU 1735 TaxID=3140361 RepID=UPI00326050DC